MRRNQLLIPFALFLAFLLPEISAAQSLRGSPSSINRMYRQANSHDLHFYETAAGTRRAVTRGRFVTLDGDENYRVSRVSYPYVLPTTHTFITRLAKQYRASCGEKLVVTSAVRPKAFRLANSTRRSVHPTGMAIDLRKPRKRSCLTWLRKTLLQIERSGTIEATEERYPPHFHVAVFPDPYTRYVQRLGGEIKLAAVTETSGGSGVEYRVRRGDSLWGIARRHGTSVDQLKQVNELSSSRIMAGQTILIPAGR